MVRWYTHFLPPSLTFLIVFLSVLCCSQVLAFKDQFDADEALLEKLHDRKLKVWKEEQLKKIIKQYPSRKEDIAFLKARYSNSPPEMTKLFSQIPRSSGRYDEAQWWLGYLAPKAPEKLKYLEPIANRLRGNKTGRGKEIYDRTFKLLMKTYIDSNKISKAMDLLKTYNGKPRYLDYMFARLQLMVIRRKYNEKGDVHHVSAEDKKFVKKAVDRITKGLLLWQTDYLGAFGNCEYAHGLYLLGQAHEAEKRLTEAWPAIREIDAQLKPNEKLDSPYIPALYHLAHTYVGRYYQSLNKNPKYRHMRKHKKEKGEKKAKLFTQAEMAKYYLPRAFNILEYTLQNRLYKKSEYSQQAIRDNEKIRELLKKNNITPPAPNTSREKKLAFEDGMKLYREEKFAKAYDKLMFAAKDRNNHFRTEYSKDAIFFAIACQYKQNKFKEAQELVMTYIKEFKNEPNCWNALYNTAVTALKAIKAEKDQKKKEEWLTISDDLFIYLATKNPSHPNAAVAAWRVAERKYKEGQDWTKKRLAAEKANKKKNYKNQEERNKDIKAVNAIVTKLRKAYEDAIPAYLLLTTNYANSKYGPLAIYRIAWIYLIMDNKEKAIEYFTKYCDIHKVNDNTTIDSKYRMGNILFALERYDEALKMFDEVVKTAAPGKFVVPKDANVAASMKQRIASTRRGAMALKPWCYARAGQSWVHKAEVIGDQIEEIKGFENTYSSTLDKNKDANVVQVPVVSMGTPVTKSPAEFDKGKLPKDYLLDKFLSSIGAKANLVKILTSMPDATARLVDGKLIITRGGDALVSVDKVEDKLKFVGEICEWSDPNLMAAYRGGKLIGVYDFSTLNLRDPKTPDEVPETVTVPELTEEVPRLEANLRLLRLGAEVKRLEMLSKKYVAKGLELQQRSLTGLEHFIENPKNLKDPKYAPTNLFLLGQTRMNLDKLDEAQAAFDLLRKYHPRNSLSQKSLIYMFKAFIKKGNTKKAGEIALQLKDQIQEFQSSILKFVAFKLFESDGKGGIKNSNTKLSLMALDEVLRRANSGKKEYESMKRLVDKALMFKAMAYYVQKDYSNCVTQINKLVSANKKTAYLFDVHILKGKALRADKKIGEALKAFNKVLADAPRDPKDKKSFKRFEGVYWEAYVEAGRTLAMQNDVANLRKARFRFDTVVDHIDSKNPVLSPFLEGAYYELARICSLLGEKAQANRYRRDYLKAFPQGLYRKQISKLPGKKF